MVFLLLFFWRIAPTIAFQHFNRKCTVFLSMSYDIFRYYGEAGAGRGQKHNPPIITHTENKLLNGILNLTDRPQTGLFSRPQKDGVPHVWKWDDADGDFGESARQGSIRIRHHEFRGGKYKMIFPFSSWQSRVVARYILE